MTRDELVWLSGFVDGEGHIGLIKVGSCYEPVIRIVNTDLNTMVHVAKLVDTKLRAEKVINKNANVCYSIVVQCKAAIELAELLSPFLVTKKAQAQALFIYGRLTSDNKSRRVSKEQWTKRDEIYQLMRIINHKGKY